MNLYAQHGWGPSDKLSTGLTDNLIDGVIFGAKDIGHTKLLSMMTELSEANPQKDFLFDSQFYASLLANQPNARLGSLASDDPFPYFEARRRQDLERLEQVRADIRSVMEFQQTLPVTQIISPNIVIRRSLDSIEATISKMFIRNAATIWEELGGDKPLYVTLSIALPALDNLAELQNFLQEMTELDSPPDGFYLLLEKPDTSSNAYLSEPHALARWMFVNRSLKVNGFPVICGYTNALAPYLAASGAESFATGWSGTLKKFSLSRFEPTSGMRRRPAERYFCNPLLKSIKASELDNLREFYDILNKLPTDEYYPVEEGSIPSTLGECLQNWEAVRTLGGSIDSDDPLNGLQQCRELINSATELYGEIQLGGQTLRDNSSRVHLEAITEELSEFEELAEL